MNKIHQRIARTLGWTELEAQSFSLRALRELVREKDYALAQEIDGIIERGEHVFVQSPPDMSWLGTPPPGICGKCYIGVRNCRCGVKP